MIFLTTLNSKYIQTSLALYTLKAYCRRDFPEIYIEEFNVNQDLGWILAQIYQKRPTVVGLSTNIWNINHHLELVNRMKMVLPETVIILGGPEVSADPVAIMEKEPGIDFIVRGEGEETLLELLRYVVKKAGSISEITGLVYREGAGGRGSIKINPPRSLLPDLSVNPFPYEDLSIFRDRLVYYESSRGCLFNCTYCLSGWEQGKIRYLPVERVKKDITRFTRAGIKTVKFVDRTFNFNRDRTLEILRFLKEVGGETEFHLEIVGELLDKEMIDILITSPRGRFRLEIGVQSTCSRTLKEIKRFHDPDKLEESVCRITEAKKVTTHLDLIAGLPYEDLPNLSRSFNYVFRLNPDEIQLGFLKLLKGSPLRDKAADYGYRFINSPPYEVLANNWLSYDDLIKIKVIYDLVEKFYNSHHFNHTIRYLLGRNLISPWDFFWSLGSYWEKNSLTGLSLKLTTLFDRLYCFLNNGRTDLCANKLDLPVIVDYLTLDFHLVQRGGAGPSWLRPEDNGLKKKIYHAHAQEINARDIKERDLAGHLTDISTSDWKRRVKVFVFGMNPETGKKEKTIVIVHTPVHGGSSWYKLSAGYLMEGE